MTHQEKNNQTQSFLMKEATSKELLCFAHRGEAEVFLEKLKFKPVPYFFDGFFESENQFLLITGEGIQSTTEKVSCVLATHHQKIKRVLNLGICAGLNSNLNYQEGYWIRTIYSEDPSGIQFQSFTSEISIEPMSDCITVHRRLFNTSHGKKLSVFADLADRELWGLASVCSLFKIPFGAYKMISDIVGKPIESENNLDLCNLIKEKSYFFSNKLFSTWSNLTSHSNSNSDYDYDYDQSILNRSKIPNILPSNIFYFTFSMEHKYINLIEKLKFHDKSESEILKKASYEQLIQQKIHPKQRAQLLIKNLEKLINPIEAQLMERLDHHLTSLEKSGIKASIDVESEYLQIGIRSKINQELNDKLLTLVNFDWKPLLDIVHGEVDV